MRKYETYPFRIEGSSAKFVLLKILNLVCLQPKNSNLRLHCLEFVLWGIF